MNDINFINTIEKNIPTFNIQPRRAPVYIGFGCHLGCGFCYYKHKCNESMFSLTNIFLLIDFEYTYGIRDFEITGGEPGEFVNLRKVCEYIKAKDNTKISIITNGSIYASNVWDLIDEVLLSYHLGKDDISYDKYIFPNGTTFNKAKKISEKAHLHNIIFRTNTVIGTFNINNLLYVIDDLIKFKPDIVNFLPINLFNGNLHLYKYIDYNIFRKKIKNAIDSINSSLNVPIFVRYFPFCDMEGYELYIVGNLQHIYDWFDWNIELSGSYIINLSNINQLKTDFIEYGKKSLAYALRIRHNLYFKSNKCLTCKYYLLCDGVEHKELSKFIIPKHGILDKNILKYMQDTLILYNLLYKKHEKNVKNRGIIN